MNGRTVLGALALVVIGLLTWELRWVLLVLFGAVVLAVAVAGGRSQSQDQPEGGVQVPGAAAPEAGGSLAIA